MRVPDPLSSLIMQERLRRIKLALDDYRGGPDSLPLGD